MLGILSNDPLFIFGGIVAASSSVIVVTLRSGEGSWMKRLTTDETPFNGVKVRTQGPRVVFVRVRASENISNGGLLIEGQIVDRCALESLSALAVGLEGNGADIAALMSDPNSIDQVG